MRLNNIIEICWKKNPCENQAMTNSKALMWYPIIVCTSTMNNFFLEGHIKLLLWNSNNEIFWVFDNYFGNFIHFENFITFKGIWDSYIANLGRVLVYMNCCVCIMLLWFFWITLEICWNFYSMKLKMKQT